MKLQLLTMTVALTGAVLFAPISSHGAPLKDDNEFAGSLGYDQGTGRFNDGSINSNVSYARYFTPWFNVGFRQGFLYTFRHNVRDKWLATSYPSIEFLYNTHPDQVVVPYINLGGGIAWNDNGNAGLVAPGAGLKFFLNEQTFVSLGYNYVFLFNDVGNTFDNGINSVRAGFGFDWGGDRTSTLVNSANRVEKAGTRVETAAKTTENAANTVGAASNKVEKAADEADAAFQKSLRK